MKQRILTILSQCVGTLCHPLWMPTYGILLFCAAFGNQHAPLPIAYWLIAALGTLFLTAIIPLSLILFRIKQGTVTSIEIRNAQERTPIYIYTIVCYGFWCWFLLRVLHAPLVLFTIGIGATLALVGILFINRHWKISAHLTGIGGLIGGICAYCLYMSAFPPLGLICLLLLVALIVMYSRIYTDAHTPQQVVAGLLFGLIMTFFPSLLFNLITHV